MALSCCVISQALAQVVVTPSISTKATYTDGRSTSANSDGEFLVEVTPRISLRENQGFLTGSMDASLKNIKYFNDSSRSTSFVAFRGEGHFEAVEDVFFIDASGSVSRNDRSAFASRSESDALNTRASNETRFFSIAPRLQFHLGNFADGRLQYSSTWNSGGSKAVSAQRVGQLSLNLDNRRNSGPLGWFAGYDRVTTKYDGDIRDVTREVARLGPTYRLTPQFTLRASVGRESNDYASSGTRSDNTYGFGFDWVPTIRTSLSAFSEERIFGRGYDVRFKHRMRRSQFNLSFSRSFSSSTNVVQKSLEDYYYDLIYSSLSGIEDEAQRDALTRILLVQLGLDGASGQIGFVSNAQVLTRQFRAGWSITGVRNTLTISYDQRESENQSTDLILSGLDDFAISRQIKSKSMIVSLAHRLSGFTSLNTSLSRTRSEGSGSAGREQQNTGFSLGLTRRLGAKTNGGLTYTHTKRTGDFARDTNTLTATLGIRF